MTAWFPLCPQPPAWEVDWTAIDAAFPWVQALRDCLQDPVHHAEGDVWTHTRMACGALAAMAAFRALPADERLVLFAAVLLHDVAKPATTRTEIDGAITAAFHGPKGAIQARTILWRMHAPAPVREQVAALIRFHQAPFHPFDYADPRRRVIEISQTARCDLLVLLAEADARGRRCDDQDQILENVALFAELCREQGCWTGPYLFPSDHARVLYFRTPGRDPDYPAHDDTRCEAVLMSGLPGAGKDHWLRQQLPGWPVVSLDAIREQLGIAPAEPQGEVINYAREQARSYLRQGISFAWNGTNLSRDLRSRSLSLFADYHARIRIVYLEVPPERLANQNRGRRAAVPEAAIDRLLARWEPPDLTEAHRVDWVT